MIGLMMANAGQIPRLTVREVIAVGMVTVLFAVLFRRFALATAVSLPLMGAAAVNYIVSTPTNRGSARPTPPSHPKAARHAFPWFTAGVAMVALFLVLTLTVVLVVYLRTRESDFDRADWYDDDPDNWYDIGGPSGPPPYPGDHPPRGWDSSDPFQFSARARAATTDDGARGSCRRLARLTRAFLLSLRDGRRATAETLWFLDALIRAAGVVTDDSDRDRSRLRAAVGEAERRWQVVRDRRHGTDDDRRDWNIHDSEPS